MGLIVVALLFVGCLVSIIGGVWGLVLAFNDHLLWGFAYLLVPFASMAFFGMRWSRKSVRQAFWLWLAGVAIALFSLLLSATVGRNQPPATTTQSAKPALIQLIAHRSARLGLPQAGTRSTA